MAATAAAATSSAGRVASTTAKRPGSAAARARKPSRTRRWKARSNSASKRVTSPGATRARPASTGRSSRIVRSGPQAVGGRGLERPQPLERDARAVALVGEGRVGIAGAQDGATGLERRPDDLGHELAACGVEQERVGDRVGRGGRRGPRQQDLAQALAEPCPAGFAGEVDVDATAGEMRREGRRLGRLAGAFGSLERDEPASRGRPGSDHGPSVADRRRAPAAMIRSDRPRASIPTRCLMLWDATP